LKETGQANISRPHDLLVKSFLSEPDLASDLFKNYFASEWVELVDFDNLKGESTETVDRDLSELRADFRYSAKFKDTDEDLEVSVFLEYQSRPDRFMSFRLLRYVCAAYQQHLEAVGEKKNTTFPFPLAVVLHHGKSPWKKVLPMRELIDRKPGMAMDILQLPICLIDLARIPGDQLRGHPAVCALLDSLQSASVGRLQDRATGIFSRLRNVREEGRLKSWSTVLATYYLAVQGKVQENFDTLLQALKTLYSIREAEKLTVTFAQSWIEEGIAIGEAKGKEAGKAEGKIEAALTVLESRFGAVPVATQKKLMKLQDTSRVEKMVKLAATCQSLKEFQKAL
jgi:predicted transposase YdaD